MLTKIADIILVKDDRILLVQQKKLRAYGLWSLPGGHVEAVETPEAALAREVKEELGTTLKLDRAQKIEHDEGTDEGKLTVFTFVMPWTSTEMILQAEELIGFGWFTQKELKLLSSSLRSSWIISMVEQVYLSRDLPSGSSDLQGNDASDY